MSEYLVPAPHDWLQIGEYSYDLSPDTQRCIVPVSQTDYPERHHVLIVNEPHSSQEGHHQLYCGLAWLFNDYPILRGETIFLAEGHPSGERVSLDPLNRTNIRPTSETVKDLLGTFSVPGYMAYEWVYGSGIPIEGAEDKVRYDMSQDFLDVLYQQGSVNLDRSEMERLYGWPQWLFSCIVRNHLMASSIYHKIQEGWKNPILFAGGLHLHGMDEQSFLRIQEMGRMGIVGPFMHFTPFIDSMDPVRDGQGIYKYLRDWEIGFTLVEVRRTPTTPLNAQQYGDTFTI